MSAVLCPRMPSVNAVRCFSYVDISFPNNQYEQLSYFTFEEKNGKHKRWCYDTSVHQHWGDFCSPLLERGGGLRGKGATPFQHTVSSLQYLGVHFVLPISLSKCRNLSSLLTLYLKKRLSRLSREDQILPSPSFPATSPPSLLPTNSEQRTKVLHLWGGRIHPNPPAFAQSLV